MPAVVNVQKHFVLCFENLVSRLNLFQRSAGDFDGEAAGGFFQQAVFQHEGARGDEGEDVAEVEVLLQTGEVPARSVTVFHVLDRRQPTAADGDFETLVQSGDIHRRFAA